MDVLRYENFSICDKYCQCCLKSSGEFRNMLVEFTHDGVREVYQDILRECLFIQIPVSLSDSNVLICSECINKLRETSIFRQQIQASQRKLRSMRIYHMVVEDEVLLKQEIDTDEEKNVSQGYDNNLSATHRSHDDGQDFNSENILQMALKRTKRNLELLKSSCTDSQLQSLTLMDTGDVSLLDGNDSEPEDRVERKKYLGRKRYAKSLPFKLEKTDRTCNVCNESFPTYTRLVMHMPEHYPNHICNHCGRLFILRVHLDRHVRHTHSTERVQCPTCKKLVKKASLVRHMRLHTGDIYIYSCHYCPEKLSSHSARVNHMWNKHNHKGDEYKCQMCSKVYRTGSNLSKHMKIVHYGEKKHKCPECDIHFYSKYRLRLHMVKHTQEKNYECKICNKRYGRQFTLKEHMKIHNNIKNFVCTICNRAFTQKCTLTSHIKTHEK